MIKQINIYAIFLQIAMKSKLKNKRFIHSEMKNNKKVTISEMHSLVKIMFKNSLVKIKADELYAISIKAHMWERTFFISF
ncbi:unnamed protein product [Blepharisma stoltei]|uniref:Uncharacterized protein n=1 Tax=Blepharisma stoltei TaxID=1481888 RepID=A0AAU9IXY2_9CILI|nr:unnamed protein product [Blepharisma stoltei]